MDTPLALVALGLFAVCGALLIGRRERAMSSRTVAAIVAGLTASCILGVSGFVSGGGSIGSWIGLIVWLAACVYAVLVLLRGRRHAAARDDEGERL